MQLNAELIPITTFSIVPPSQPVAPIIQLPRMTTGRAHSASNLASLMRGVRPTKAAARAGLHLSPIRSILATLHQNHT